jgi:hypothetical protein
MARRFLTPALLFRWSSAMTDVAGTSISDVQLVVKGEGDAVRNSLGPCLRLWADAETCCDDIKFAADPLPNIDRSKGHTVMTDRRMCSPHTSRHSR